MGCIQFIPLVLSFIICAVEGNFCRFSRSININLSGKIKSSFVSLLDHTEENIFDLNQGIVLLLINNSFDSMPKFNFSSRVYRSVVTLDLSDNEISSIADSSLDHFICLQKLILSNNNIKSIPRDSLYKLRHLEELHLQKNNVIRLLSGVFGTGKQMLKLKILNLSKNNISDIMENVFHKGLVSLKEVDLSKNSLLSFEPWAYLLTKKHVVFDLKYNYISTFTNTLNWTMSREHSLVIDLRYNRLKYFNNSMFSQYLNGRFPSAYEIGNFGLNVRNNPWFCDCRLYGIVIATYESFYIDRSRDYLTCSDPKELAGRDLGYFFENSYKLVCNISENCPEGCKCVDRPHEGYISIECSGNNFTMLPVVLPEGKLHLDFSNNKILHLDARPYLKNVTHLNVAKNGMVNIKDSFMKTAVNLEYLDLQNNSLNALPVRIQNLRVSSVKFLGNRIVCGCDTMWLNRWFRYDIDNMTREELESYVCWDGLKSYPIKDVTWTSLRCYTDIAVATSTALGILLVLLVAITCICCRCRYEAKVLLFQYLNVHPFDQAACDQSNDSTKKYDIYLSIDRDSAEVRYWVKDKLLRRLEKSSGSKAAHLVYYPCRQDDSGESIADQMVENINKSRRVLAVVSNSYVSSGWSMEEFDHSHRLLEEAHSGRLLILIFGDLDYTKVTQEPLKSYLSKKRCFQLEDKWMWNKIRYELPHKPLSSWASASRESITSGISSINATLSEEDSDRPPDDDTMSCDV